MTAPWRPSATRTPTVAAALLLAALALTGCSDDAAPLAAPSASRSTAPSPGAGEAEVEEPLTPSPSAPRPSTPEPATPAPSTSSPRAGVPSFPPASTTVQQGSEVWAVYLAVSRLDEATGAAEDQAELDRATAQAEAAGYDGDVGGGDVDCDQGARQALGLDADRKYLTASLFFDTQAQARQFVDAYAPPVVGTARITAFCLD